jgi:thiol-disulfide isomerase/thioredoxin
MDEYFDSRAVCFLEYPDITREGQFAYDLDGKKLVVMVGGTFCGHCKHAAPEFNKFAKQVKDKAVAAVVQVDGSDNERALGQVLGEYANISGVPSFLLFDESGKFVKKHDGQRTVEGFLAFLGSV